METFCIVKYGNFENFKISFKMRKTFSCADMISQNAFLADPGSSPGLGCTRLLVCLAKVDGELRVGGDGSS